MKSIIIRYLLILQSLSRIPSTLQSFGHCGFSRNTLQLTRDEVSGSHLPEAGQMHNGRAAVGKIGRDPHEKDWDTIYKEYEDQRIETLASSLGKLRNDEKQTVNELKEQRDFLENDDDPEPAKFARLRKALIKMMRSDPSIMQPYERIDGPIVEVRKLLEVQLKDKAAELEQCRNMFRQAQLDFHLIIKLRSLMQAIKPPEPKRRYTISCHVAAAIDSLYKSDQENFYFQVHDRIVHAMWNAWDSLGRPEISNRWNKKLERALRRSAKKMRDEDDSHDFIQLCETKIFREPRPDNWLYENQMLRPYETWGWARDPWAR